MAEIEEDLTFNSSVVKSQYLTFVLSEEEFAVPITKVKEIIEYGELTKVPMVPEFIRGALNLRGKVVPVLDLSVKFSMTTQAVTKRTCVVIMELEVDDEVTLIGFVVDRVIQVIDIQKQDIEQAPSFGAKIRTDFIEGMGKVEGRFLIILDVGTIFSAEEIAISNLPAQAIESMVDVSNKDESLDD